MDCLMSSVQAENREIHSGFNFLFYVWPKVKLSKGQQEEREKHHLLKPHKEDASHYTGSVESMLKTKFHILSQLLHFLLL